MEQLLVLEVNSRPVRVLLTTAADRQECQAWEWWDTADVIISYRASVRPHTYTITIIRGESLISEALVMEIEDDAKRV